ncbi:MAG TPA: ABC transporter permease [Nitriliruptorales bacterium]|nr:ABC transporter permease [Nitriliruptorales bacterium]
MTIWTYLARRWPEVLQLTVEHALLVGVAVLLATLIGVTLGTLVYRSGLATSALLTTTNSAFTIPALAYFGVLVFLVGLGFVPSVIVLTIYALLPIVRNTVTGLREVPSAVVKSATGMGMGRLQRLLRIELPLAWPVILSGMRVASVMTVGIAAIAAWVAGPGLGRLIFGGLAALGSPRAVPQAVAGTVGVVLVALVLDATLGAVGKLTTPKALRGTPAAGGAR